MATLPNTHPGKVLREEFLRPLGITPYRLAKEIGVPQTRVSGILAGKRAISVDTAVRLARYFGTTPQLWLNLQVQFDLEVRLCGSVVYDRIAPYAELAVRDYAARTRDLPESSITGAEALERLTRKMATRQNIVDDETLVRLDEAQRNPPTSDST